MQSYCVVRPLFAEMASSATPAKRVKRSDEARRELYEALDRERTETQNTINHVFQELSESLESNPMSPFTEMRAHADLVRLHAKLESRINSYLSNGYSLTAGYITNNDPRLWYAELRDGGFFWMGVDRPSNFNTQEALFVTRFPADVDPSAIKLSVWYDDRYTKTLAWTDWPSVNAEKAAIYKKTGLPFDHAPAVLNLMFELMWQTLRDERIPDDLDLDQLGEFYNDTLPFLIEETVVTKKYTVAEANK